MGLGLHIRKLRDRAGLTQEVAAHRVGRSLRWWAKLEAGEVDLRLSDLIKLAEVLSAGLGELLELSQPRITDVADEGKLSSREDGETKRRQFLGYVAALADPGLLLLWASDGGTDQVEAATRRLVQRWRDENPAVLLPAAHGHLAWLLPVAQSPGASRALYSITAEAALLAGWLSFRLDNRGAAQGYWQLAGYLAREAGDGALEASVLVARSFLESSIQAGGRAWNGDVALSLLDQAIAQTAGQPAAASVRVRALARRAEEHALRGDGPAAGRDLEAAERELAATGREPDRFAHWGAILGLEGYHASCALLLDEPKQAARILEAFLPRFTSALERAIPLADLGAACAQQGEIDQACSKLAEAATLAAQNRAIEFLRRVVGLRQRYLGPWPAEDPPVRRLDEQLAALA